MFRRNGLLNNVVNFTSIRFVSNMSIALTRFHCSIPYTNFYNRLYQTLSTVVLRESFRNKSNVLLFKSTKTEFASNFLERRCFSGEKADIAHFWNIISSCKIVEYMQKCLIGIHEFTGLSWWCSIVFSTFLFRGAITLPLAIYQAIIVARIENLHLELHGIVAELKREVSVGVKKFNWTENQARIIYTQALKNQWKKLIIRDNCHPAKTLIVLWAQIPLWISQSIAIRNLINMEPDSSSIDAQIIVAELMVGGFGWISNLTEIDESYILPATLGLLNLAIVEVNSILRTRPSTGLSKYAVYISRVFSIAIIPVGCFVPSALCVYWVSSSFYSLLQTLMLYSPTIRRIFFIPITKYEISNPYSYIWSNVKGRMKIS